MARALRTSKHTGQPGNVRLLHLLLLALLPLLTSCVTLVPSPEIRRDKAQQLAEAAGWQRLRIPTSHFVLTGYLPKNIPAQNKTLTIYFEGDGLAWITSSLVSPDPTPAQPVGLELALRHPRGDAAYLARPCQYVEEHDDRDCPEIYWTNRRFAPEVVEATNQAVEVLKQRFGAEELQLVGYSGGGAIAALVAARRQDVVLLATVAGNLDSAAWTRLHHASPLTGSLNPADHWQALLNLPQVHFVGGRDQIISPAVAESFQARFPKGRRPKVEVIPEFDHVCCWTRDWQTLFSQWSP